MKERRPKVATAARPWRRTGGRGVRFGALSGGSMAGVEAGPGDERVVQTPLELNVSRVYRLERNGKCERGEENMVCVCPPMGSSPRWKNLCRLRSARGRRGRTEASSAMSQEKNEGRVETPRCARSTLFTNLSNTRRLSCREAPGSLFQQHSTATATAPARRATAPASSSSQGEWPAPQQQSPA